MDLRALRYFVAVYESGSVSAAARRCFIAQPSISVALTQLEAELGVRLFERYAKGVKATDAGERLYPMAANLLASSEAMVQSFQQPHQAQPLCLGLMRSLGARRMSDWLKRLLQQMERLELTLVNPEESCQARIVTASMCQPHEQFEMIWRDDYLLALPAGHPLTLKRELGLADLGGQPFLVRAHCEANDRLRQALNQRAITLQPRANLRTIEYSLALVKAGVGLALVPDWPEHRNRADMILKPLSDWACTLDIGLAYPQELSPILTKPLLTVCRETNNDPDY